MAQTARDGGAGAGDARLQLMVQQLTVERNRLQSEVMDLQAERDEKDEALGAAQTRIAELEAGLAETQTRLRDTTASNDRNEAAADQLRARMEEIVAQFRETIEVLRETENERNELSATLATTQSERDQCVTNNLELYKTGVEVLDEYEHKGCFASMRQRREPFLQIKRVQIENLVDDYKWRLEDEVLQENREAAAEFEPETPD